MCGGKNMHVFWSTTCTTLVFRKWSVNSFQQAHDIQYVSVPPSLHLTVSLWLWRVGDKVLCAVGVLWPPAHAASWVKRCQENLLKPLQDWEYERAVLSQKYESVSEREEQEVRKATKIRFLCFHTDRLPLPAEQNPLKKIGVWFLWMLCPNAVLVAAAQTNQFLNLAVKYVGEK